MGAVRGFLSVVVELPNVLAPTLSHWLGWAILAATFLFIFLTLRTLWIGRARRFMVMSTAGLVVGVGGYLSAFSIDDGYQALAAIFLFAFIIVVAITTMALAVPVYIFRSRTAGQIESGI
jgi:hypothetical protein